MKLTQRQEKFVRGIISGLSQREAYKQAGYKTDSMSENAIDVEASKLVKHPKVSLRLGELRGRLLKEAEDECIVSAKEVIRELKHIAFDDIGNYLSFHPDPESKYGVRIDIKDSGEVDTRNISEVSIGKDGFKFKLYSKDTALVNLARHLGLFDKKNDDETQEKDVAEALRGLVNEINS